MQARATGASLIVEGHCIRDPGACGTPRTADDRRAWSRWPRWSIDGNTGNAGEDSPRRSLPGWADRVPLRHPRPDRSRTGCHGDHSGSLSSAGADGL